MASGKEWLLLVAEKFLLPAEPKGATSLLLATKADIKANNVSQSEPLENRRFFLRKNERLRSKIAFEYLFEHGSRFSVGVLRFFYAFDVPPGLSHASLSVAVTAPKKNFKRAVDRNILKRRMREAYRLNKHILLPTLSLKGKNLILLVKYNNSRIAPYDGIAYAMTTALKRLEKELNHS